MATLEELKTQRDALAAARARGVAEVQYTDKRVRYKSDSEMAAALADLDRQIAAQGSGGRLRTIYATTTKGV